MKEIIYKIILLLGLCYLGLIACNQQVKNLNEVIRKAQKPVTPKEYQHAKIPDFSSHEIPIKKPSEKLFEEPEIKIFIKELEEPVGRNQSQNQVETFALQKAKRLAVEEAGAYISSLQIVQNGKLTKDQITNITSGIVKTEILGTPEIRTRNGTVYIKVRTRIQVDTRVLEYQVKALLNDDEMMKKLEEQRIKNKELEDQLAMFKTIAINKEESDKKRHHKIKDQKHNLLLGIVFITIPKGCFQMGSFSNEAQEDEKPRHNVCIDTFSISKYEITNDQYIAFLNDYLSKGYSVDNYIKNKNESLKSRILLDSNFYSVESGFENYPMVNVSWDGAKQFTIWLSERTGFSIRLPKESEWEYSCRAGTKTKRFWGDQSNSACYYSNVQDYSGDNKRKGLSGHQCDDGYSEISPVGKFFPNSFELYDMLGNVYEWCEDIYIKNAYEFHTKQNPVVNSGGFNRVVRGGSYINQPAEIRCAKRSNSPPREKLNYIGFRVVKDIKN